MWCLTPITNVHNYLGSHLAPCFKATMRNPHKTHLETHNFYFCRDNINYYIVAPIFEWIQKPLAQPLVWPVQIGTNLTQKEVDNLTMVGFMLVGLENIFLLWIICNGLDFGSFHLGNILLNVKGIHFSMAWMNTIKPEYNKQNIF